ncbi:MAG: hypothetical protein KF727_09415 [Microbacteriaceae bacterium]|nr:hypothetical protein [Microbacteriaceae bacterium]
MNERSEVRIRRAPKLGVFIVIGGALGAIATLVLTSLYPADKAVGFAATFGYFLLYGIPAGVALGAVVGLVLDAISRRRARTVTAEREVGDAESPAALELAPPEQDADLS